MKHVLTVAFAIFSLSAFAQKPSSTATQSVSVSNTTPDHVGSVIAPKLIHQVGPEYSDQARKEHFSGSVTVHVIVDTDGVPKDLMVAKSAGHGLDEEALKAVGQYRFQPAMLDGRPVKVELEIEVHFQIGKKHFW